MTTNPTRGNQFKTLDAFMENKMAEFQQSIKHQVDKMVMEQLGKLTTPLKKATAEIATRWKQVEMEKRLIQNKIEEVERERICVLQNKESVERCRKMLMEEFGREKQQVALEKQHVERQRQELESEKQQVALEKQHVERQRQEVASEKQQVALEKQHVERQRQEVESEKQQVALEKQHVERQREEVAKIQLDMERQLETMEHYLSTAQANPSTPRDPPPPREPPPVELGHEQGTTDNQPPQQLERMNSTHEVEVKLEVTDCVNLLPTRACSSRTKSKPDRYTYNPKKKPTHNKSPLVVSSSSLLCPINLEEDDKENMASSQEHINLENACANQQDLEKAPVSASSKKKRSL